MNIDAILKKSDQLIHAVATQPEKMALGMTPWLDYCDRVAPKKKRLWSRLRKLDYDVDFHQLTQWLTKLLRKTPPGPEINGLWFGMYNPIGKGGEETCQPYLGGSTGFKPRSKSNEWVCDLTYFPKGRYANSSILAEVFQSVDQGADDIAVLGEAFLGYGYMALTAAKWCHSDVRLQLLGDAPMRAIAIGHDSGPPIRIAVLRAK